MNRVNKFLKELDDYELAYFAKYRLTTYLPETQSKIKEYLAKKGLTESKIEQLISVNPKRQSKKGKQRCPRCSSDKIRNEKVEWTDTSNRIGFDDEIAALDGLNGEATYKNQVICNVCGFWIKDPNNQKPKSFSRRVFDTIVGYIEGVISGI